MEEVEGAGGEKLVESSIRFSRDTVSTTEPLSNIFRLGKEK